jgi:RPA family protein
MAEEQQKRQIAEKARIKYILQGRYVQQEGWNPNYIEAVDGRKISRVNIIGAVVSKEEGEEINYNSIIIDDGSGKISARVFGEEIKRLKNVNIGDVVLIVGRPREYGGERYILLEIIKKIEDKKWIEVRQKELGKELDVEKEEKAEKDFEEEVSSAEDVVKEESTAEKIIDFVRKTDGGDGVDIEDIVNEFSDEDCVKNLLSEGELFEIRPGRVKVLE